MNQAVSIPWVLIALDALGTVLVVMGILGLTGVNFGNPVLTTVAPGFIIIGVLLMIPFIVWVVRKAHSKKS